MIKMVEIKMNENNFLELNNVDGLIILGENNCCVQLPNSLSAIFYLEHFQGNGLEHCDIIIIGKQVFFIELKNTSNTTDEMEIKKTVIEKISPKFQGSKEILKGIFKLYDKNFTNSIREKSYVFYVSKNTIKVLLESNAIISKAKPQLLHLKKELSSLLIKPCNSSLYQKNDAIVIF